MYRSRRSNYADLRRAFLKGSFNCPVLSMIARLFAVLHDWLHSNQDLQATLAGMMVVLTLWWLLRLLACVWSRCVAPLGLLAGFAVISLPYYREPLLQRNYAELGKRLQYAFNNVTGNV